MSIFLSLALALTGLSIGVPLGAAAACGLIAGRKALVRRA